MAFGLDANGFLAPRTADLITLFRDRVEAELIARGLAADIEWERDTFWGIVSAVFPSIAGDLADGIQALYDARDPNVAQGVSLDSILAITGLEREAATYSQGTFKLVGTNGTVVPLGSEIEGGGPDGVSRWNLLTATTIGATDTDAIFRANDTGPIRVEAGPLEIVTPVAGWTGVYAVAAVFGGTDAEKDSEARLRRQESLQISGSRSVNAIRAKLLALDFVTAAVVVDNPTDAVAVVGGLTLGRRALGVVIYPSPLTAPQEQEIAELIYKNITEGVTSEGTEAFLVTGLDGYGKSIKFSYASALNITVVVTVDLADGYVLADVQEGVENAVKAYFDSLTVGSAVRILQILGRVADVTGVDGASVTLNAGTVDIIPTLVQYPVLFGGVPTVTT